MPAWPEYLDALERYVEDASQRIAVPGASGGAATDFAHPRPQTPLPSDLAPRALAVLARLEAVRAAGEARRMQVLAAQQRLAVRRVTAGSARPTVSASL